MIMGDIIHKKEPLDGWQYYNHVIFPATAPHDVPDMTGVFLSLIHILKAVIEGGLERKPENVLIYATSNRRHLIKETFKDKADRDEELHTNDTVQEKLSLVARFGVTIYFGKPDKKEFQEIVRKLAQKSGIDMPEDELLLEANKWELSHGGLSGRTAQQFVDYLAGMQ